MTPSPQHCDHECVCADYKASYSDWDGDDPLPCIIPCIHRSRPSPAPTEPCDTCTFNDVCSMQASESCKRAMQEQHDAAIVAAARKDERNKLLDELVYWMYDCPFGGKENSDKSHKILAVKIESLRVTKENLQ